jgi:hypothetical protein
MSGVMMWVSSLQLQVEKGVGEWLPPLRPFPRPPRLLLLLRFSRLGVESNMLLPGFSLHNIVCFELNTVRSEKYYAKKIWA